MKRRKLSRREIELLKRAVHFRRSGYHWVVMVRVWYGWPKVALMKFKHRHEAEEAAAGLPRKSGKVTLELRRD